ncbi:hypothetical protein DNH61_07945 [Paenibacillus sambharensis]|uniref:Uncharacterized protein n=1 Tax=Paenibacillus sambharensis TaxID=1803190 RepID=A0A2W1LXK7_9BACL|nr:hypothetical protein [Paenibacillus sambharensis]PZD96431.1 hypothetical protein DNH61_07945 [Paenibacillus sambharensis]
MAVRRDRAAGSQTAGNGNPIPRTQLTPQQIAIAFGLLSNALTVNSVLIDRDRNLQFVVTGRLANLELLFKDLGISKNDMLKMFD